MFRAKFLFAFLVGICVATCVAPGKSLAGSCLCNGFTVFSDGEGSIQNTIENLCIGISHPNAEGIPINNQSDCDRIVKKQYNANDSVKCVFDASETCESLNKCNGKDCFASDATCTTNAECEKLKFGDSNSAIGVCKNDHCYLDSISLERYKNTPSLLGVTADLQLKKPIFEVRIPGLKFTDIGQSIDAEGYLHIPYLGEFVSLIYKLAMGLGSIIAVVMIIMQGAKIVVSGGGELKNEAYLRIGQIVIGLVILWGSYAILYTINPELVQFRVLKVKYIDTVPLIDVIDEPVVNVPITLGSNNVPIYKQFASPWGKIRYGDDPSCTTIQAAGCGPSSLAMVLSSYGTQVTPDKTAAWMGHKGNGRVCNQGTSMDQTLANLPNSPWPAFKGRSVTKPEALNFLKQNKPIIFLCKNCSGTGRSGIKTYGGHYLVLTGMDSNGNVTVNDSGANEQKAILNMSTDQLDNNGGFWFVDQN